MTKIRDWEKEVLRASRGLEYRVLCAIQGGFENAMETEVSVGEFDVIAEASIAFTPEFIDNQDVRDWFLACGYSW